MVLFVLTYFYRFNIGGKIKSAKSNDLKAGHYLQFFISKMFKVC